MSQSFLTRLAEAGRSLLGATSDREVERRVPPVDTRAEIATVQNDPYGFGKAMLGLIENDDPTLIENQGEAGAHYKYPYGLYDEALRKDPHLRGVLAQRFGAVLSAPWVVHPGDDTPEAKDDADFTDGWLKSMRRFSTSMLGLLLGIPYGFSASEVLWRYREVSYTTESGRKRYNSLAPLRLKYRRPRRFVFGAQADENGEYPLRLRTQSAMFDGIELPERHFVVHRPTDITDDPHGDPLLGLLWGYSYAARNNVRFWLLFNNKFAAPITKLTFPRNATLAEKKSYKKLVSTINQNTGVTIPEGVILELLQASTTGAISTYKDLAAFCNESISKAVLGQTLTTQQGDTGARAMAQVHMDVRGDIIKTDADALCDTLNSQLIPWVLELNRGAGRPCPRLAIDTDPPVDAKANLERFALAKTQLRIPLSIAQIREEGNLAEPKDEADTLEPGPDPTEAKLALLEQEPKAQPGKEENKPAAKGRLAEQSKALTARLDFVQPRANLLAENSSIPDEELRRLIAEGIAALAGHTAGLPDIVVATFAIRAAQVLGEGWQEMQADSLLAGWSKDFAIPAGIRAQLVDRLNDDLTIAGIFGRDAGAVAAGLPAASKAALIKEIGNLNPVVEALWAEDRIIPQAALNAFASRLHHSLTAEQFYQLDALGRAASFTAWDLVEGDIRELGGALQDAIREGWTNQKYADWLHDNLRARYVQQGTGLHAWHIETIYDTNTAVAYNQSQMDEMWEQRELFPIVQFANPAPSYPTCVAMAGKAWPITSPTWRAYSPPLHFHCGSSLLFLSQGHFDSLGISLETGSPADANGLPVFPMEYAGPLDPETGQPLGKPARFGAWAPQQERIARLYEQLGVPNV